MSRPPEDAPPPAWLQALYEAMRQRWLGGDGALDNNRAGLAVLLRQGVAGWVSAWSPALHRAETEAPAGTLAPEPTRDGAGVPEPARAEMAAVLANMVWAAAAAAQQGAAR